MEEWKAGSWKRPSGERCYVRQRGCFGTHTNVLVCVDVVGVAEDDVETADESVEEAVGIAVDEVSVGTVVADVLLVGGGVEPVSVGEVGGAVVVVVLVSELVGGGVVVDVVSEVVVVDVEVVSEVVVVEVDGSVEEVGGSLVREVVSIVEEAVEEKEEEGEDGP